MIQEEEHSSGNLPIGPSYEEFLKEKEKEKLKKLPPERVGANFDHTSNTSAGWLPSFGRVWNNGRRWQSRHQFKTEVATRSKQSHKGKSWRVSAWWYSSDLMATTPFQLSLRPKKKKKKLSGNHSFDSIKFYFLKCTADWTCLCIFTSSWGISTLCVSGVNYLGSVLWNQLDKSFTK